jgi:hypothetical protein
MLTALHTLKLVATHIAEVRKLCRTSARKKLDTEPLPQP